MNLSERYLTPFLQKDLKKKMVFLGGPRQVGKTTLAQTLGKNREWAQNDFHECAYYNWDDIDDQRTILERTFPSEKSLLIFDEIHKYHNWKNYIKGLYDTQKEKYTILVTGSARLNMYRKGGDSMIGRYHYHRLHPFSLAEVIQHSPNIDEIANALYKKTPTLPLHFQSDIQNSQKIIERLLEFGGFPEPFFEQDPIELRRWQKERRTRLVREDIRDTSTIHELSKLQILMDMIPDRVGSRLSLESLRQDIGGAHQTISKWIEILENFYYTYRIYPFSGSLTKSLKKEPKIFLWDWSEVKDEGARFENLIASHLLKYAHFLEDILGANISLQYWRDKDGREVDFILSIDSTPVWAIEVKLSDTTPSKHLHYLKKRVDIQNCFQIVKTENIDFEKDGIRVMSAGKFLTELV